MTISTTSSVLSSRKYFLRKKIPYAQASSRKAFSLLELLISIVILSLMMVALYNSYASLNMSNEVYKEKSNTIKTIELKKKTLYLDLLLAMPKSLIYLDEDTKEDIITFQTTNSIHKRFNPYVTYLVKDSNLYRLESLKEIKYPFSSDVDADVDDLGEVNKFKVYKSNSKTDEIYLVNIEFKDGSSILQKSKVLSQ